MRQGTSILESRQTYRIPSLSPVRYSLVMHLNLRCAYYMPKKKSVKVIDKYIVLVHAPLSPFPQVGDKFLAMVRITFDFGNEI
jgi:hypothetical protein